MLGFSIDLAAAVDREDSPGQSWRSWSHPTSWITVVVRVSIRPWSPSMVVSLEASVSAKPLAFC
jgi:hypothetical protein